MADAQAEKGQMTIKLDYNASAEVPGQPCVCGTWIGNQYMCAFGETWDAAKTNLLEKVAVFAATVKTLPPRESFEVEISQPKEHNGSV